MMTRASLLSFGVILAGALCAYSDVPPPVCPPPAPPIVGGPNVQPDTPDPTADNSCVPVLGENTSPATASLAERNAIDDLIAQIPIALANGMIQAGDRVGLYKNIRETIDGKRTKYPSDPWPEMKDVEVMELLRPLDTTLPHSAYYADEARALTRAISKNWWQLWRAVLTENLDVVACVAVWTALPDLYLALGDTYEQFYVAARTEAAQLVLTDPLTSAARALQANQIMPWVPYIYNKASAWPDYAATVGARLVGWALIQLTY